MKKQFFIGLLLVLFLGLQANIIPQEISGNKSDIAIEQSDVDFPDFKFETSDMPVPINEAEVEISPGLNKEVFIASTYIDCGALESNKINRAKDYVISDLILQSNLLGVFINESYSGIFTLNHELCEISPGDNLA